MALVLVLGERGGERRGAWGGADGVQAAEAAGGIIDVDVAALEPSSGFVAGGFLQGLLAREE